MCSNIRGFRVLFFFGLAGILPACYLVLQSVYFICSATETMGIVIAVHAEGRYARNSHARIGDYYCPEIRYKTHTGHFVEFSDRSVCTSEKFKYRRGMELPVFYKEEGSDQSKYINLFDSFLFYLVFMLPGFLFMAPYSYVVCKKYMSFFKKHNANRLLRQKHRLG